MRVSKQDNREVNTEARSLVPPQQSSAGVSMWSGIRAGEMPALSAPDMGVCVREVFPAARLDMAEHLVETCARTGEEAKEAPSSPRLEILALPGTPCGGVVLFSLST